MVLPLLRTQVQGVLGEGTPGPEKGEGLPQKAGMSTSYFLCTRLISGHFTRAKSCFTWPTGADTH